MMEDALLLSSPDKVITVPSPARWSPPRTGYVKVNTDGAFDGERHSGGSGSVIRDDSGMFLAVETRRYDNLPDAFTIEALAARDGLLLAERQGCSNVVLEFDNLTMVNMINLQDGARSPIAGI